MKKIDILGVQVDALHKDEFLDQINSYLIPSEKKLRLLATTYSEFIVAAQKDEEFRKILNSADINTADGIGILWAASFLNRKVPNKSSVFFEFLVSAFETAFEQINIKDVIPEKISGADIIWNICELALRNDKSVFLLGGHGDVASPLKVRFPELKIAGREESNPSDEGLVDKINSSGADILLVAFDPVKQYKWLWENKDRLNVRLAAGLGGTFDYLTGKRKRAPQFFQRLGLEWLYRLITQPWRIKRMWNAIYVFSRIVLKEKYRQMKNPT